MVNGLDWSDTCMAWRNQANLIKYKELKEEQDYLKELKKKL